MATRGFERPKLRINVLGKRKEALPKIVKDFELENRIWEEKGEWKGEERGKMKEGSCKLEVMRWR